MIENEVGTVLMVLVLIGVVVLVVLVLIGVVVLGF